MLSPTSLIPGARVRINKRIDDSAQHPGASGVIIEAGAIGTVCEGAPDFGIIAEIRLDDPNPTLEDWDNRVSIYDPEEGDGIVGLGDLDPA